MFFCSKIPTQPQSIQCKGFYVYPRYIRENPSHVFSVLNAVFVNLFCEIKRCLPSHTLSVYNLETNVKRIVNHHSCKNTKSLLICKQVRLWIAEEFRERRSPWISELSWGRGSKFPTLGQQQDVSGLSRYYVNFNSFQWICYFTLRIARLNPPQVFYRFGFPGSSDLCVLYFPLLYFF